MFLRVLFITVLASGLFGCTILREDDGTHMAQLVKKIRPECAGSKERYFADLTYVQDLRCLNDSVHAPSATFSWIEIRDKEGRCAAIRIHPLNCVRRGS